MTSTTMNPKVDAYLSQAGRWREEIVLLRSILLDSELTEQLKWGKPCYSLDRANVVLIVPFKDSCALLLTKGALLDDPAGLLVQPSEQTQSARQIRFKNAGEIAATQTTLNDYINRAIAIEQAGLSVAFKSIDEFDVPEEFQARLGQSAVLREAFSSLTPRRQRAYLLHFGRAKQSSTRAARVDKHVQDILDGKGLNEW
ncbi:MAG: YdeI/OmpD-associated family protein [Bdellovibrionales bacterium]|nr:YdeI/OmpD-associated family protein [Massilia sp.]